MLSKATTPQRGRLENYEIFYIEVIKISRILEGGKVSFKLRPTSLQRKQCGVNHVEYEVGVWCVSAVSFLK